MKVLALKKMFQKKKMDQCEFGIVA
jgi:hypothetical protein